MLRQRKFHWSPSILVQCCQRWLLHFDGKLYYSCISNVNSGDDNGDKFRCTRESRECNFQLYKSRGQHLLTSTRVLDTIVKKSNIKTTDTVLEIGPGTGNLTLRLLEAAHKVVAVELDWRMAEALQKRVAECGFEDRLTLIRKDALKTEFPKFDLVVANIPYCISSPLLAKLLFGSSSFRSATLLLQKEFAHRLLANPGDSEFNRLAVNVKLVAEVEHIMDVSKRDFFPVPKVDSSVVLIRPKMDMPNVDLNEWCAFTRTCFNKKNKTIGAIFKQKKNLIELMRTSNWTRSGETLMFKHGSGINDEYEDAKEIDGVVGIVGNSSVGSLDMSLNMFKENLIGIIRSSGFEEKRPSKLSIEELLHLLTLFNENKIHFHDKARAASNAELAVSFEL